MEGRGTISPRRGTQRERRLAQLVRRSKKNERLPERELKRLGVSAAAVTRAKRSEAAGRELGRAGRQRYLNDVQEAELALWVNSHPMTNRPTLKQIASQVSDSCLFNFSISRDFS